MIKVLFDTNIILDIALEREPFFQDTRTAFEEIDSGLITGFVTATTLTDIYYITKKEIGHNKALEFIQNLIEVVDVAGVDRSVIEYALVSGFKDFEDAVQEFSSQRNAIEIIVTRNVTDFKESALKIFTPQQFVKYLKSIAQ